MERKPVVIEGKRYMNVILNEFTMEEFLESLGINNFENYKSNLCHLVKSMGDLHFIIAILKKGIIDYLFKKDKSLECFYLLGMVDYLCRVNGLPVNAGYGYIRKYTMENLIYPEGVDFICYLEGNDKCREEYLKEAIPEFLQFNIVEGNIRNVA